MLIRDFAMRSVEHNVISFINIKQFSLKNEFVSSANIMVLPLVIHELKSFT